MKRFANKKKLEISLKTYLPFLLRVFIQALPQMPLVNLKISKYIN